MASYFSDPNDSRYRNGFAPVFYEMSYYEATINTNSYQ